MMSNIDTVAPPSTRIISWQQEVLANDSSWQQKSRMPIIYEFSNGRVFTRNPNPYTSAN